MGDAADETHYGYQFLLDDEATQSPSGIIQRFTLPPINKSLLLDVMSYFNEKYTNGAFNFTLKLFYLLDIKRQSIFIRV